MHINKQVVRFNQVLTKEINKKVSKTLSLHKLLFSERKPSINRVKNTLKLTGKQTRLN